MKQTGNRKVWTLILQGLCVFTFVFCTLPIPAKSADPGVASAQPEVHVKLRMLADVKAVQAGKPFKLGIELTMDPHWHTYYKESGDAGMPTSIKWHMPPGFKAGDLLWVKPTKFDDQGIVTYGYQDKTLIAAPITPPRDLKPGTPLNFSADVKWLSCKDICLPGNGTTSLELSVGDPQPDNTDAFAKANFDGPLSQITGPAAKAENDDSSKPAGATGASGGGQNANGSGQDAVGSSATPAGSAAGNSIFDEKFNLAPNEQTTSFLPAMLLALVGGLILNLMPCVLPVIAIKVVSFMQQAHDDRERVRKLGLAFISGIMSSFMLLATIVLIIQAAGTKAGWGFQFQFPGFVIAMSAIVTLFALSLFGLFYVSVGHGQALDKLSCKEGYTGTFFKGVLATVLSTPCSAPCLGTALGYAFTQNWLTILAIFFMIGLGMSIPYVVLCFNPDLMKFVPKPGIWMEKFKESLGFVLLATVVWLLWVLGTQVGLLDVIWTLAFLVSLSFAAWFVARFTNLNSNNKQKAIIWGAASLIAGGAFYFFIAIQPGIGFLAPADATNVMPEESAAPPRADGITWEPLNLDKLQQYRRSGKTVFLDFTAAWCLTCKANERAVIMSTPVMQKLKALQVVTMQADWTKQDATITKLLSKFGRSGVPLYVIFPGNKPENPIVLPEVIDQDIVIKALNQAGASKP